MKYLVSCSAWPTIILAYAFANAILYCSLLPLWEGFDEAFHFGYLQYVANTGRVPVLGDCLLSREIWRSLQLAPVSSVVRRNIPSLMTYDQYFGLEQEQRMALRTRLAHLSPSLQFSMAEGRGNYEAHQAPLAYLCMAPIERLLSEQPLLRRVWLLRVAFGLTSCVALWFAIEFLANQLQLTEIEKTILLFLAFSTQMFYATVCHIANDWLSVPIAVAMAAQAIKLQRAPNSRNAVLLATGLALGLLTKAYFLAYVPVLCISVALNSFRKRSVAMIVAFLAVLLALAGPWYGRNILLYKSVAGTVEEVSGLTPLMVVDAMPQVPWLQSIIFLARGSLWTGNNTFSTFAQTTVNIMLFLLVASLSGLLIGNRRGRLHSGITVLSSLVAVYVIALMYVTAQSFIFTGGLSKGASVWYAQPLIAPVLALALFGTRFEDTSGKWIRICMVLLWTYVLCLTYLVKLIPLYGGYSKGRGNLIWVSEWWYSQFKTPAWDLLGSVTLVNPTIILGLVALVVALTLSISTHLCRVEMVSAQLSN